ncbi:PadR family transcriptional regulator [Arthrobacter cryoconiti]|uniref:PadR family transcriptional regulator n=1 Tax=Arthrobacter cryoconiti TaxID=748907 RepID=A0ABV8QX15_9MICC|nr:PadR family transcriptional regulator [Arthrobacter cryoconiti]
MQTELARLERDRFVTTCTFSSTSGPPRKYFTLTPEGQKARASARQQWQLMSTAVHNALAPEGNHNDYFALHQGI